MKKAVCLVALVLACTLTATAVFASMCYSAVMKVTDLDFDEDIVSVVNWAGHEYSFYGAEDWLVDDYCSFVMFNNFTNDITDDIIICERYERLDLLMER